MDTDGPAGQGPLRLTYAQIAERLSVTPDAARKIVRRRRWPRSHPNRLGEPVIVTVPADGLATIRRPAADGRADGRDDGRADEKPTAPGQLADGGPTDISNAIRALQAAVALLGHQLTREQGRADAAEAEIARLHAKIAELEAQERARAEALEAPEAHPAIAQAEPSAPSGAPGVPQTGRQKVTTRSGLFARLQAAVVDPSTQSPGGGCGACWCSPGAACWPAGAASGGRAALIRRAKAR